MHKEKVSMHHLHRSMHIDTEGLEQFYPEAKSNSKAVQHAHRAV